MPHLRQPPVITCRPGEAAPPACGRSATPGYPPMVGSLQARGRTRDVDAIVVGSGPNGLAAAIALAQAGRSVRVLEAAPTIGGGTRTEALTLPGFRHDVCSAIHPLGPRLAVPAHAAAGARTGSQFVHPEIPLAHPLDDGSAVALHRSVDETADGLGVDAAAYRRADGAARRRPRRSARGPRRPAATAPAPARRRALRPLGAALGDTASPGARFAGDARAGAARRQRRALDAAARRARRPVRSA